MHQSRQHLEIEGPFVRKPRSRLGTHVQTVVYAGLVLGLMALSTSPGLM